VSFHLSQFDGNTVAGLSGRTDNSYTGGSGFDGVPGGATTSWSSLTSVDFGIRTFVTQVPEPSIAALLTAGSAGFLAMRRRRKTGYVAARRTTEAGCKPSVSGSPEIYKAFSDPSIC